MIQVPLKERNFEGFAPQARPQMLAENGEDRRKDFQENAKSLQAMLN